MELRFENIRVKATASVTWPEPKPQNECEEDRSAEPSEEEEE